MKYLIPILMVLFFGCSAQWHLHRAMKKNHNLFDTLKTVEVKTIELPRPEPVKIEFSLEHGNDTIQLVNRQGVELTIVKYGMYAEAFCDCPPPLLKTVTIKEKVIIEVIPKWLLTAKKWLIILLSIFGVVVIAKFLLPKIPFLSR